MELLLNRELSWLAFNHRVLQEAADTSVPLMQRLRFLGIYSNNNDEFFKVRMANLVRTIKKGKQPTLSCERNSDQLLQQIHQKILVLQEEFQKIYRQILGEMREHGIRILMETELDEKQQEFCRAYFRETISRQLVPLFLHTTLKVPFLSGSEIYLAVSMNTKTPSRKRFAILQIPVTESNPRFIRLPSAEGRHDIIFQDDVIRLCLDEIFFMFSYKTIHAYTFKLVRDAYLSLDDDLYKSLLEQMEEGLEHRQRGKPVRLIYDSSMPKDLLYRLADRLKLKENAFDAGGRYHMMRDLMKFPVILPELEPARIRPVQHPDIPPLSSLLKKMAEKDILLAFPYQTFDHVIDLLREAAIDPKVVSIHITLYRVANPSKIVTALINAAYNGKKVVAAVELMARFDEKHNVNIIDALQEAGVQVVYGPKELKVHSKLVLIQRCSAPGKPKGYVYVGTGNFNESTATLYSDFGLLTMNEDIVNDARNVFSFLVNPHKHFSCKRLVVAPYNMRKDFEKFIYNEIENAKKGKKAYIWIKCNNITDEEIIKLLYKASKAGVEVRLIVRGSCCLQPQHPDFSENIRAISIVDKFLEHARLLIFCNDDKEVVYISSADLMTRNLDRRLEVATPIQDKKIKEELIQYFLIQWSDNVKARDLTEFGKNSYVQGDSAYPVRSQVKLYDYYANPTNWGHR